ncbi:MAG: CsgG/HfaB family protein [Syntrophorhabdaceae bacterium]
MKAGKWITITMTIILALVFGGICQADDEDPVVDNSKTTKKLQSIKRPKGQRKVVTIYEFRSSVPEVNGAGATDMFTTALIKSGYFAVAERQRLDQGVMREKQLQASGAATGKAGRSKLAGAQYIFEGTVSEANPNETNTEGGFNVGGMNVGGAKTSDSIGLDVRIIDAQTALVLDSVNVRKKIVTKGGGVAGIGRLAQSIAGLSGQSIPLNPDANVKSSKKEGVDQALRSCIEAAVYELVTRYGED